ncbi:MAG: hypothetical protein GXP08_00760 [Gammaproteobacteria bacterium]|nr:hypothetical protein [Gammaproteobacteria bacterium]
MNKLTAFFTKEKRQAFFIHLGISLGIFLVLLYFILVYWYPHPLFTTDGGWQGIRLIAFVDIILGPLLTLVVYKKAKPRLVLDLTIIAVIQLSALVSGTWVVYSEHPTLVVFIEDHFKPITAYQVNEAGVTADAVKQLSKHHPPIAFLDLPNEADAMQALLKKLIAEQRPLSLVGELYRPLTESNMEKIRHAAVDMDSALKDRPEDMAKYQHYKKQNVDTVNDVIYIPLHSRYIYSMAVVDRNTLRLVDVLDILVNPKNTADESNDKQLSVQAQFF